MLTPTESIWHNGRFIAWNDAKIHVLSHVVSYGSSVFEGIRCYETVAGPAIFRLREHVRRLLDSSKIYRIDVPFSLDELSDAMVELVRVNNLKSCYLRPIVLRGYGDVGVYGVGNPTEVYLACWEWGKYLGEEALSSGVDVCISSWNRIAPNTLPALAKAGANYMNSQLIRMEAHVNGYSEGIALDEAGYVSEGSGENVFIVRDGKILTPPLGASVLPGITRDTVVKLAQTAASRLSRPLFRASCSTSPTRFSSREQRPKSPLCGRWIVSRWVMGSGDRSRNGCRKISSDW
jgi:branched-chain amino acid aminotransferase, group I